MSFCKLGVFRLALSETAVACEDEAVLIQQTLAPCAQCELPSGIITQAKAAIRLVCKLAQGRGGFVLGLLFASHAEEYKPTCFRRVLPAGSLG